MFLSFNAAFSSACGGLKVAASATSVGVQQPGARPVHIVGGFFSTHRRRYGAAHDISLDHTGHPVVSKLRDGLPARLPGKQADPAVGGSGLGKTGTWRPMLQDVLPCATASFRKLICSWQVVWERAQPLQRLQHGPVPGGITTQEPTWSDVWTPTGWRKTSSTTFLPWTRNA